METIIVGETGQDSAGKEARFQGLSSEYGAQNCEISSPIYVAYIANRVNIYIIIRFDRYIILAPFIDMQSGVDNASDSF